jgi:tetratricopeptide (TPR) repeat protein
VLSVLTVLALTSNPYLEEGRKLSKALEFEAAARTLAIAVEQPGLSVDERRVAFDELAKAFLATNQRDQAERAYRKLLEADPYVPTPDGAPKVVECFMRAKQAVYPKPAVTLKGSLMADRAVTVKVFDPWALVKRVRWLERTTEAATEQRTPELVDRALTVTPSAAARSVLFDALDPSDVLLAHVDVQLPPVTLAPVVRSSPRWVAITLTIAAVVAAGVGATFFYLGYRDAPTLTSASSINEWNAAATRSAALAWTFGGVAVGAGVAAGFVAMH